MTWGKWLAFAALFTLTACATPEGNCALATSAAIALDLGGSWAAEQHYADAQEICE